MRKSISRGLPLLLVVLGCSMPTQQAPEPGGIVCDRFQLRWELDGDDLLLSVDTDLPDEGELSVSVGRSYYQAGSEEEYSRDYLSVFEPVSKWREPNRVPLDADKWRAGLAAHQEEMARIDAATRETGIVEGYTNLAFEVASISDRVEIRALLHLNQDDPRFGRGNSNLSGAATSREGVNGRVLVEAAETLEFPLD